MDRFYLATLYLVPRYQQNHQNKPVSLTSMRRRYPPHRESIIQNIHWPRQRILAGSGRQGFTAKAGVLRRPRETTLYRNADGRSERIHPFLVDDGGNETNMTEEGRRHPITPHNNREHYWWHFPSSTFVQSHDGVFRHSGGDPQTLSVHVETCQMSVLLLQSGICRHRRRQRRKFTFRVENRGIQQLRTAIHIFGS